MIYGSSTDSVFVNWVVTEKPTKVKVFEPGEDHVSLYHTFHVIVLHYKRVPH